MSLLSGGDWTGRGDRATSEVNIGYLPLLVVLLAHL